MVDPTIIAAAIIGILGAVGTFIAGLKIKKCVNPLCEIDCKSPPGSPPPQKDNN